MVLFSDKEAQPLRVREPVVVEQVVSQAAPEEACIREPVREEQVITPASSSVVGRGSSWLPFCHLSYGNFTNLYRSKRGDSTI